MNEQKKGCLDPDGNFVESLPENRPIAYRCFCVEDGEDMTNGRWFYREDEPTDFGKAYAESEGLIWEPLYAAPACVSEKYINTVKAELIPQNAATEQAAAEIRNQALEDAARVCDNESQMWNEGGYTHQQVSCSICAAEIRKLKQQ